VPFQNALRGLKKIKTNVESGTKGDAAFVLFKTLKYLHFNNILFYCILLYL
jgi:hypothetical protein